MTQNNNSSDEEDNWLNLEIPQSKCRKCDVQICIDMGSVWSDWDYTDNSIRCKSISFDGYGANSCPNTSEMDAQDFTKFKQMIQANFKDIDMGEATAIVRRYFDQNIAHIWDDALDEYQLITPKKK